MRRNFVEQTKVQLELEGYIPGTPQFDTMLIIRKVQKCREFQGVGTCSECPAYDSCQLSLEHRTRLQRGMT